MIVTLSVRFDHRPSLISNARVTLFAVCAQIVLLVSMFLVRVEGGNIPVVLPVLCSLIAVVWVIGGIQVLKGHNMDRSFIGADQEHSPGVLEKQLERVVEEIGIWLRAKHGFMNQIIVTLDTRTGVPEIYINATAPLPDDTREELTRAARTIAPVEGDPQRLLPIRFPLNLVLQKRVNTSSFSAHQMVTAWGEREDRQQADAAS